jgi:hypothetical protein
VLDVAPSAVLSSPAAIAGASGALHRECWLFLPVTHTRSHCKPFGTASCDVVWVGRYPGAQIGVRGPAPDYARSSRRAGRLNGVWAADPLNPAPAWISRPLRNPVLDPRGKPRRTNSPRHSSFVRFLR